MTAVLLLLALCCALRVSGSSLASPGTYVMFKGKSTAKEMNRWITSTGGGTKFFNSYGEYDKEEEVVEFDVASLLAASRGAPRKQEEDVLGARAAPTDTNSDDEGDANRLVLQLLKALFPSKSDVYCSEGDRMIINNSSVIASLQHPFLGSYVYAMAVSNGITGATKLLRSNSDSSKGGDEVIGAIDIRSINPRSTFSGGAGDSAALPKRCHLRVVVKKSKSKKYSFIIKSASVGLSEKHIRKIKFMLRNYIESSINHHMGLLESRFEQQRAYSRDMAQQLLSEQQRQRDKVLNPDKYRSRSPTVRRVGSSSSGGSGGRYKPSASAQSRRVVKRG